MCVWNVQRVDSLMDVWTASQKSIAMEFVIVRNILSPVYPMKHLRLKKNLSAQVVKNKYNDYQLCMRQLL